MAEVRTWRDSPGQLKKKVVILITGQFQVLVLESEFGSRVGSACQGCCGCDAGIINVS